MNGSPRPVSQPYEANPMQGTHIELDESPRQADEKCPSLPDRTGDSKTHDLGELWRDVGGSD